MLIVQIITSTEFQCSIRLKVIQDIFVILKFLEPVSSTALAVIFFGMYYHESTIVINKYLTALCPQLCLACSQSSYHNHFNYFQNGCKLSTLHLLWSRCTAVPIHLCAVTVKVLFAILRPIFYDLSMTSAMIMESLH